MKKACFGLICICWVLVIIICVFGVVKNLISPTIAMMAYFLLVIILYFIYYILVQIMLDVIAGGIM